MSGKRSGTFWIGMAFFQLAFGLSVFAATRAYYLPEPSAARVNPAAARPALPAWQERSTTASPPFGPATMGPSPNADPVELARQADAFFGDGQYERAAQGYQQLVNLGSGNANIYNNLGITLHYLGRSDEALQWLDEGVALDPTYQRIWLTLGFVNSQVGNLEQARASLTRAVELDPESEIGQSAAGMLASLP
jgi:tetratricopeptide (TPR) repeat protein